MARKSAKLQELEEILEGHVIDEIEEINTAVLKELSEELSEISDPRDEAYVMRKLGGIIMITLFAAMANANEWMEIEVFGRKKEKWLRTFLELPYGIPTDNTFRTVISKLNVLYVYNLTLGLLIRKLEDVLKAFESDRMKYMKADAKKAKDILSCDGKSSVSSKRNATDKDGAKALNTLNAYSSEYGMCVRQEFI